MNGCIIKDLPIRLRRTIPSLATLPSELIAQVAIHALPPPSGRRDWHFESVVYRNSLAIDCRFWYTAQYIYREKAALKFEISVERLDMLERGDGLVPIVVWTQPNYQTVLLHNLRKLEVDVYINHEATQCIDQASVEVMRYFQSFSQLNQLTVNVGTWWADVEDDLIRQIETAVQVTGRAVKLTFFRGDLIEGEVPIHFTAGRGPEMPEWWIPRVESMPEEEQEEDDISEYGEMSDYSEDPEDDEDQFLEMQKSCIAWLPPTMTEPVTIEMCGITAELASRSRRHTF